MWDPERLKMVPLWVIAFVISAAFHEFAHAWAAYKLGDNTAEQHGRLTVNPLVHIDPFGLIFLIFMCASGVGFGWAKPVPVNEMNFRNRKFDGMLVSLAGPVMNILLAIPFVLIFRIFSEPLLSEPNPIGRLLAIFLVLNVILAAFNLIPIYPLDGGRIVEGILPEALSEIWARLQPFGFFILIALYVLRLLTWFLIPAFIALSYAVGPENFDRILNMI